MELNIAEKCVVWSQLYVNKLYSGLRMKFKVIENPKGGYGVEYSRKTPFGDKLATFTFDPPVTRGLVEGFIRNQVNEVILTKYIKAVDIVGEPNETA